MNAAIHLGNGEEHHAQSPETFEIPDLGTRWMLRVGDYAKLMFLFDEPIRGVGGERMWVCITSVHPESPVRYIGELSNAPTLAQMQFGEPVEFGPEHVIGVVSAEKSLPAARVASA